MIKAQAVVAATLAAIVAAPLATVLAAGSTVLPILQFLITVIALPLSIYAAITARRALEAVAPKITKAATEGAVLLEQLSDDGPDA